MVDRDLVLRKAADLDLYLEQLLPYASLEIEAYKADWRTQRIVERTLHLAIELCLDLADHVVADRRLRVPESGADAFRVLSEAGLLPVDLGRTLGQMVGFRNILVHDYARLDPAIVLKVLRTDVQDLRRFSDLVVQL